MWPSLGIMAIFPGCFSFVVVVVAVVVVVSFFVLRSLHFIFFNFQNIKHLLYAFYYVKSHRGYRIVDYKIIYGCV